MYFRLNIGTVTNTVNEYDKQTNILAEQRGNINSAITELTESGWSGKSRDKFIELHEKRQILYAQLEADIQYMRNALENEEKPKAIQLKRRSEDFVNCIKRSGSGFALTSDGEGVISLDGGQFQINNNVNNCTSDDYPKMHSRFQEIMNLANSLEYTSFPIGGDIFTAEMSIKNQTTSLIDFDDSFNIYCNDVKQMESNICSVFSKISGVSGGISTFGSSSVISPSGEIQKDELIELMLKNQNDLTDKEKAIIEYAKAVLGEDECNKLVENVHGPTLTEAAELAADVYLTKTVEEAKKDKLAGGWKLDYVSEPQGYSLKIGVYKRVRANGEIEYTVVNRGSREWPTYKQDWENNAQQVVGASNDMKKSIQFADDFVKNHPGVNITFVGHSKGGAEASANAVKTNENAIIFNPAAVNIQANGLSKQKAAYKGKMTAYIVKGEILSNLEGDLLGMTKPIGKVVHLPTQYPNKSMTDGNAIKNHLMPAVKAAIKEQQKGEN